MVERRILVAEPHGFCAGVRRALEAMELALRRYGAPIYCYNEIVHNRQVVESLRERGVRFIEDVRKVPAAATLLLSAHGVPPAVRAAAAEKRRREIDATCPVVEKVHREVKRYATQGCTVLLIGHHGHDEIVGVQAEAPEQVVVIDGRDEASAVSVADPDRVAVVSQTTLSFDETREVMAVLKGRFPGLNTPQDGDICHATTNRQQAVKLLAGRVDIVLVLGSANSSNSRRLVEVAAAAGVRSVLVETREELADLSLEGVMTIGLTAGASTPERFVTDVIAALKMRGFTTVEHVTATAEQVHFRLPRELR